MLNWLREAEIVALRNEKGSYNSPNIAISWWMIVALRNEKGSYNGRSRRSNARGIVALRNEKGSYNVPATNR